MIIEPTPKHKKKHTTFEGLTVICLLQQNYTNLKSKKRPVTKTTLED